ASSPAPASVIVTVRKSTSDLVVSDEAGKTLMYAPVTTGSEHDPLPIGEWKVTGVQHDPAFHYNPALFWDADPRQSKATIPPGPNNPAGVVWIDISRPHPGLPRTPAPSKIGQQETHGRPRLAKWGAVELGGVEAGVARPARHARGVRRMTAAFARSRPPIRHLVAAGLLGFVLGAFVVASLGTGSPLRSGLPFSAASPTFGAVDEPSN